MFFILLKHEFGSSFIHRIDSILYRNIGNIVLMHNVTIHSIPQRRTHDTFILFIQGIKRSFFPPRYRSTQISINSTELLSECVRYHLTIFIFEKVYRSFTGVIMRCCYMASVGPSTKIIRFAATQVSH